MSLAESEPVHIRRLLTRDDVARTRAAFVGAYQTIFAGFPYFQRYTPEEAEGVYRRLVGTPDNITLVATVGDTLVGFGAAIPARCQRDVAMELTGLVPLAHTVYLAELGVLDAWRGRGLGRALIRERLRLVDPARYTHAVLRVSVQNTGIAELYRSLGFEDMGVYQEVRSLRTDGRVRTDRRFFMSRVLSQTGR